MNKLKPFSHHFVWLSCLFILGSGIINLPFAFADKLTFLGFLIAFLIAIPLTFAVIKLDFLRLPILLLALYLAADALVIFLKFIEYTLLGSRQNFWILLLFILPLIYFCFRKPPEIFNFSLICGLLCGLLLIFFFFATFKDFNFKNIYIYSLPNVKNLFYQTVPYIKTVTLPIVVLTLFAKQNNIGTAVTLSGIFSGAALLVISILNSVLLFGAEMAGELSYPYANAISTVTFGNLFSRLDGFSYFIYFVTAIIKITVCVEVVKRQIGGLTLREVISKR
ncbi:MAG: hypothetical protein E7545_07370 [Ruminococcaceae bacterium]|nr:hypothetical protein [Oscillospiraceae bacterium]